MTSKKAKEADIGNELLDDFDKFENFVVTKWKFIIYVCIAIVIGVAVGAIGFSVNRSMDAKAITKIAAAQTIDELKSVIDKYPGKPAITNARVKLASLYIANKDYDNAISQYSSIAAASRTLDAQKWRAELNIGYISELKDKKTGALKFAEIAARASLPESIRAEANFSAGRLYLALNEKETAIKFLKSAETSQDKFSDSSAFWKIQAKQLLERIGYKKETAEKKG